MILAYKEDDGYRPVLVVQNLADVRPSSQNTTYVYGLPGEDRGFVNDPPGVFLSLMKPLMGKKIEWDQLQAEPLDPNQAWQVGQMTNQFAPIPVFPFVLYKSAMLTLVGVHIEDFQSLLIRLEFLESPFPLLQTDPPVIGGSFSTYFQ